ncbi:MAG: filamentous hemagglutinin N-terminal domain-containing protein, partial [Trichodesmium sp.]
MKTPSLNFYHLLALILGIIPSTKVILLTEGGAIAQPITPANDGTNTTVTPQGNEFNIEGGTRSGANLFHSFDQFNVNSGQTANFLTTPDTSNILGRVTGGNASYINGLIQVIGGNSNLFLMNPAGIMFGPNASLNIPASFSVTTATGIGFDNNNFWFQAMGTNDYSNLVGNPSGYKFNVSTPGAIVNEGNLQSGENLTLLGGTVINTGELSTTNGNITIAAVEGGSVLRISQPGHLLSLEVDSTIEDISNLDTLSLPELLTGGAENNATSIIVNSNGELELTDNTIIADTPGNVFVSGNIDLSIQEQESESNFIVLAKNDITVDNLIETPGFVEFKAGGSINLNADIDTSVGNGNIDLFGNNDEMNVANRSEGKASINQLDGTTLNAGSGTINIELGNLGEVGDINLANLTTTGQVLVNANGGNIARVSENSLINAGSILFQTSGEGGIGLIDAPLRLDVENLEAVGGSGGAFFNVLGDVTVTRLTTIAGGDVELSASGDITVSEGISTAISEGNENAGNISIESREGGIDTTGGTVDASSFDGDGGNVEMKAAGDLSTAEITANSGVFEFIYDEESGFDLQVRGGSGNAGDISVTATGDITLGSISSEGLLGGNILLKSDANISINGSSIESESISFTSDSGTGGDINITAKNLSVTNGAAIGISTSGKGNAG